MTGDRAVRTRIGVDIGGTFTDIVIFGSDGAVHTLKLSSTSDDYARGIAEGLAALFVEDHLAAEAVEELIHGTTAATNAILEHLGPPV